MSNLIVLLFTLFLSSCTTYYHQDSSSLHKAILKIAVSNDDIKNITLHRYLNDDFGIVETFLYNQDNIPKQSQFTVDADREWRLRFYYSHNWREYCIQDIKFFAKQNHVYILRLKKTYGNRPTLFSKLLNLTLASCDIEVRDNNRVIQTEKFPKIDILDEYYDTLKASDTGLK